VHTTRFWNNLHQVHSRSKDWKVKSSKNIWFKLFGAISHLIFHWNRPSDDWCNRFQTKQSKHNTESLKDEQHGLIQNQGWTYVLAKGKQFLLHIRHRHRQVQ